MASVAKCWWQKPPNFAFAGSCTLSEYFPSSNNNNNPICKAPECQKTSVALDCLCSQLLRRRVHLYAVALESVPYYTRRLKSRGVRFSPAFVCWSARYLKNRWIYNQSPNWHTSVSRWVPEHTYFGVKKSKVKVTSHKNSASVGSLHSCECCLLPVIGLLLQCRCRCSITVRCEDNWIRSVRLCWRRSHFPDSHSGLSNHRRGRNHRCQL